LSHYVLRIQFGYGMVIDSNRQRTTNKMLTIDAEKMILDFGGVKKVVRALKEVNHPRTEHAVRNWVRRNNIPIDSVCHLAVIARRKNQRFDLLDYTKGEER